MGRGLLLLSILVLAGCGQSVEIVQVGGSGTRGRAGTNVAGLPLLATKNTTRLAASGAPAIAAASALAVYPSDSSDARPRAVALAAAGDWRAALAAAVLMSPPLRAPLLLSDGGALGDATRAALARLQPAQIIRVGGGAARGAPQRGPQINGSSPAALAAATAAYAAQGRRSVDNRVLIVADDQPEYAMPAAAWAAKSGDPVLFVARDAVPPETRDAIGRLQQPRIYVLGPPSAIAPATLDRLARLGKVTRISGPDPVSSAIAFARYSDGDFGWGIVTPGHGLVFAPASLPVAAPAAAALSASGTYGPLLVLSSGSVLPTQLRRFLLDIEPGYAGDPARGVYNHAWLIGDGGAITPGVQARIDALLEISPVASTPVRNR
ncbi:MAG: hypothetical protein NVS1B9_06820 [Solirubrobacteraceae bacterium]